MKCPYCGFIDSRVVDSRSAEDGATIRRRRECLKCSRRFTSYETVEQQPVIIIKRDGSRVPFVREKLIASMLRAFEKRSITLDVIENAVTRIEQSLQNTLTREISSQKIGEMVLSELRRIDEVAYIRFASVYRQFKDADSFLNEIRTMVESNN